MDATIHAVEELSIPRKSHREEIGLIVMSVKTFALHCIFFYYLSDNIFLIFICIHFFPFLFSTVVGAVDIALITCTSSITEN